MGHDARGNHHADYDIFDQLLEAKWRDVSFPVTKMKVSIAHDLAEHKYWGVDGARVESTGLAPWRFSFSVPFVTGLSPAGTENWGDNLYPDHMRKLIEAFQRRDVGALQHPEFGIVNCKAERFELDWDAARRGGADAEISFVETLPDEGEDIKEQPVGQMEILAGEMMQLETKVNLRALLAKQGLPLPPYLEPDSPLSFGEFMSKIKAITDYPTLLAARAGGSIDSLLYHVDRVGKSVEAARTAVTWPVTQNVERIKAAAHEMRQNLLATAGARSIGHFIVPHDTTIAGVARQLPANVKMGDVIKLNPGLMLKPEVPKGTRVRYYTD